MSDSIQPPPENASEFQRPSPKPPVLLAAFGATERSVDVSGRAIHVLDRVADTEGLTGIVVGVSDRNVVLQVEAGFSEHASDAMFATTAETVRVLEPVASVAQFSELLLQKRRRADEARAATGRVRSTEKDFEELRQDVAEHLAGEASPKFVPGVRVYDETNDSGGIVLLVGEDDVSYLSDTNLDGRLQFDSKPKAQLTVMNIPPLPREQIEDLIAKYAPDPAWIETAAVEKAEKLADAIENVAANAQPEKLVTVVEFMRDRIRAAGLKSADALAMADTRKELRTFEVQHIKFNRNSRSPNEWEKIQQEIDGWESLGLTGSAVEECQAEFDEVRGEVKAAYEETLAALPPVAIGARVFDYANSKTGIVLMNQPDFDRAVILVDGDDCYGNVYLDTIEHEYAVVSKAPPLPRDEVVKLVTKYMPGLTTPADVAPIDASEGIAREILADADNQVMLAFGEDRGETRIPDGAYVFNQATKTVAIALFGSDRCVVVETVGTTMPKSIDVWDNDFVVVLNLPAVDHDWIAFELSELLSHPNVGDAVGKANGTPVGRIILAHTGRAVIYWPGNAALKPRFEARELGNCPTPPFRQYSVAEVQQIIRCHQQLEDAPLAGTNRTAGAA